MSLSVALRHRLGAFDLDAAFDVPAGVTALFGPSGSGKSTVLNAVAGLLTPQVGRVDIDGTVLLDTARGVVLPAERRRCGVVFQDARLFPHLDVGANLRFGARRAATPETGPRFDEVVGLLGLDALLSRRPRFLSGGERQRVAIGRALLSRPRLLLMDEPLAALDAPRRAEILPYLERLRAASGLSILYVTHALDEVDRLADTLVLIESGRVVASGAVTALMGRTDLPLLTSRADAGVLIEGRLAAHWPERGLSELAFDGGALLLPLRPEPLGAALRLRVQARDVAIAVTPPTGLSSHNILPATLAAIAPDGVYDALLTLQLGGSVLLARITRDAVARLDLRSGMTVHAIIKTVMLARQ